MQNKTELVFLNDNSLKSEPFTTDEIIAEYSGNSRDSVTRLIRTHLEKLEKFGRVGFEIRASGRARKKIYHLNEPQATLIITFLANTVEVVEFKVNLVNSFFLMREKLKKRQLNRAIEQPTHRDLADAIKEWEHLNKYSYSNLNSLLIKISTNLSIKQLREQRSDGLKTIGLDLLNSTEQERYLNLERVAIALIQANKDYAFIKSTLMAMSETEAML